MNSYSLLGLKICCGIFLLSAVGFLAYYLIETNSSSDEERLKTDFGEVNPNSTFLDQPEKGIRAYPVELYGSGDDQFVTDDDEIKDEDFNQYDNISGKGLKAGHEAIKGSYDDDR